MFIGKKKKKRPEENPVYFSKEKKDKVCLYMLSSRDMVFICIGQHNTEGSCVINLLALHPTFDNIQIIYALLKIVMKAAGLTRDIGIYISQKFVSENLLVAVFQAGFEIPEIVELKGEKLLVCAKLAQYKTCKRISFIKKTISWTTQLKLKKKDQITV